MGDLKLIFKLIILLIFFLNPIFIYAQSKNDSLKKINDNKYLKRDKENFTYDSSKTYKDSLKIKKDTLAADSLKQDTLTKDKKIKGDIKTTIEYQAKDSITLNVPGQTATLYDKAKMNYDNRKITANHININWNSNIVTARYTKDSSGKKTGIPVFKEGKDSYEAEKIKYNYQTKRGIVKNIITQESEGYVKGKKVKINEEKEVFVNKGIYTDCDCEDPCYKVKAHKIKLIPDEKVVTGPFYMELESIPTPIAFLFGYFPLPKQRSSGIITPAYGESQRRGFFLRNGGYYWAVNDYVSMEFLGEIYSLGSYGLTVNTDYKKRYRYNGNFNIDYMRNVNNPDDLNQFASTDIWLSWSHRPVSRKSSSFSANVNAGTSTYNRNNEYTQRTQQGQFNSSINYRKNFVNTPFRLNLSARQDQNVSTKRMNFDLPVLNVTMNRIYPFKDLIKSNENWAEPFNNFNVNYTFNGKSELSNIRPLYPDKNYSVRGIPSQPSNKYDTITFKNSNNINRSISKFLNQAKLGAKHQMRANTSIKLFKYISLNPNFNYQQYWYQNQLKYSDWNRKDSAVGIDTTKKLSIAHSYNMGASMNTSLYGTFFIKKLGIEAIRHTVRPSIGFNFSPSFKNQISQRVRTDSNRYINERIFSPSLYGFPGTNVSKNLSFSLNNVFEMKVNNKDSTKKFKKVSILDNLNFGGNYDLNADSFNLSNIRMNARTSLFKNRFSLGVNATLNPYYYEPDENDKRGNLRPFYAWNKDQGLGHLERVGLNFNTSLNPERWKSGKKNNNKKKEKTNKFGYKPFKMTWNLNIGYRMNYSKPGLAKSLYNHNITLNGRISPTEKWNVSFNTGYDWQQQQFSTTRINITRDLNCWNFSFNLVPFGRFKSYNLMIRAKSSVLSDFLKVEKDRSWRDL